MYIHNNRKYWIKTETWNQLQSILIRFNVGVFKEMFKGKKDVVFNVIWVIKLLIIKLFLELLNQFSLSQGI